MDTSPAISSSSEAAEGSLAFDSICRCCLTNEVELKPIFNLIGSIPEVIFLFTSVKCSKDDGLPGNICTNCLHHLDKCISFKRRVEAVDFILQKYVEGKVILPEDADSKGRECTTEIDPASLAVEDPASSTDYMCKICSRSYGSKYAYNRHIKVHIFKPNISRCNGCGKKFTNKATFEVHQLCHNQSKATRQRYICQICKNIFGAEQDLFIHGSLHEEGDKFRCKACSKCFENRAKLKRHIPRHFIEKPFKCTKCDMSFTEMASLTRHYVKHTGTNQKSIHTCSFCGKGFSNQYCLKVHIRNHTGERPWKCAKCSKQFTDYRLLYSHRRLHDDRKLYECKTCRNRFRHLSTLTTHMRTHTGDRPYRCDKCKKSYKQSWSLRIHKRIHENNFICDQCAQVFPTKASLRDHLQWHTDQEPHTEVPPEFFHCKDCSAEFSSPLDLITHEKLTHALAHECDTCFGKWKTLEELVQHKCSEALEVSDEPAPDEMILLPNGEVQDCNTVVNALLASIAHPPTQEDSKEPASK